MTRTLDAIPVLVAVMRISDSVLLYVNEAFERYTGLEATRVVGHTSEKLGFWADPDRRREWIGLLGGAQGPVRDFDATFRSTGGEARAFELSADRVTIAGEQC